MNHSIKVSLVKKSGQELVNADPNPAPGQGYTMKPGETVTWQLDPVTVLKRDLQVLFQKVVDFDQNGKFYPPNYPCNPLGPFSSLVLGDGVIVGTVRSDVPIAYPGKRFFYKILENGVPLDWNNGVQGQPKDFGGGIDIPMTPPMIGVAAG